MGVLVGVGVLVGEPVDVGVLVGGKFAVLSSIVVTGTTVGTLGSTAGAVDVGV